MSTCTHRGTEAAPPLPPLPRTRSRSILRVALFLANRPSCLSADGGALGLLQRWIERAPQHPPQTLPSRDDVVEPRNHVGVGSTPHVQPAICLAHASLGIRAGVRDEPLPQRVRQPIDEWNVAEHEAPSEI